MAIYAIGDLHLSFSSDKPMNVFGENWDDHHDKIMKNWINVVSESDTVLIPGDISWALKLSDAAVDLKWLESLPGKKIMCKGNHDYWWPSLSKLEKLFPGMSFIYNTFYEAEGNAVCGTRGWVCPSVESLGGIDIWSSSPLPEGTPEDVKIYKRELSRFEMSLSAAKKAGYESIIAMLHYPPMNEKKERSGFVELMERYSVKKVVYGHLHTKLSFDAGPHGNIDGIEYILASCDFTEFAPVRVL